MIVGLALAVSVVVVASALASGTEAALFAVTRAEVERAVGEGRRGAGALRRLKADMARPITTVVVWNNVANVGGSLVAGGLAAEVFGSAVVGVFSAVLTGIVIVFAEILPKTFGERFALDVSLRAAPIVEVIAVALAPLIAGTNGLVRLLMPRRRRDADDTPG